MLMTLFDPCQTLKLILRLISTYSETNITMHNCNNWPIILSVSIYSEGPYIKIHNQAKVTKILQMQMFIIMYLCYIIYAAQ